MSTDYTEGVTPDEPDPVAMNVNIHQNDGEPRGELNRHPGSIVTDQYLRIAIGDADIYIPAERIQPWIDLLSRLQYDYEISKENEPDERQESSDPGDPTDYPIETPGDDGRETSVTEEGGDHGSNRECGAEALHTREDVSSGDNRNEADA